MYRLNEEASQVWQDIIISAPLSTLLKPGQADPCPELLQALAGVATAGFELELLDLQRSNKESASTGFCSHESRFLSTSVLNILSGASVLHRVGTALLHDRVVSVPVLPPHHLAVAIAVARGQSDDADIVFLWLNQDGFGRQWLVWLVDCLIEALCEAAQEGDETAVRDTVKLCESLGGTQLVEAVCKAGSRSTKREGRTPLDLATAGDHTAIEDILRCHYLLESLKGALIPSPVKDLNVEEAQSESYDNAIDVSDSENESMAVESSKVIDEDLSFIKRSTSELSLCEKAEKKPLWVSMLRSALPF
jgi:hypothetical protein